MANYQRAPYKIFDEDVKYRILLYTFQDKCYVERLLSQEQKIKK